MWCLETQRTGGYRKVLTAGTAPHRSGCTPSGWGCPVTGPLSLSVLTFTSLAVSSEWSWDCGTVTLWDRATVRRKLWPGPAAHSVVRSTPLWQRTYTHKSSQPDQTRIYSESGLDRIRAQIRRQEICLRFPQSALPHLPFPNRFSTSPMVSLVSPTLLKWVQIATSSNGTKVYATGA